jgi:hypothetical protein
VDLKDYLLVGSYLFGAGVWAKMWVAFLRCEKKIDRIEEQLAYQRGLEEGHDHEERITRLERIIADR